MEILHSGFDGIDIAYRANIPREFESFLVEYQEQAASGYRDVLAKYCGQNMLVAATGSRGGYRFRVDTGPLGAIWFFKKPSRRDPWGVRVSAKSLPLAVNGLEGVRTSCEAFMTTVGIPFDHGAESIGRVDYAIDLLAPNFLLDPIMFVMHARTTRADQLEMAAHGLSSRYTGVRVGKMPNKQIAIYDKRKDVIDKSKTEWWEVWNSRRRLLGLSQLLPENTKSTPVWRVEVRAGKSELKSNFRVRTWADFEKSISAIYLGILESIRLTNPTQDTNRSRWPMHPL